EPVHALGGNAWQMLVAFDEESVRRHRPALSPEGILIDKEEIRRIGEGAKEKFTGSFAVNVLLMGCVLAVIGCNPETLPDAVMNEDRLAMIREGYRYAGEKHLAGKFPLQPAAEKFLRFDGNQALGLGAILGGCRFMAAYPMTPATSIMNYFANAAGDLPIHFEQAEDEIAAVNMALGASYAGLRSMTASSGGGFDLMTEGLSLAGITETPLVVMLAQRPGPSTGLPTRTEQGDLNLLVHAGHGEFSRIIFAPGTITEAIEIARDAFDLADALQCPVLILTDQYLADSIQTVEHELPLSIRQRNGQPYDETYRRYALTEDGLSPLTYPGIGQALVRVDSDEHDEDGRITEDLDLRIQMVDKRMKKLKHMESLFRKPTFYGDPAAEWMILSWGSNRQIVEEAVRTINKKGLSLGALHFSQVYPLFPGMTSEWNLGKRKLVCLENNATGQFAGLLKREIGLDIDHKILKYNGECFTADEIRDRLLKIMEVKP
ncbi:MAG TPA: 2-oxoacid:acceptor oxidoreductase subunit alpha, partial [Syntrophales bacterium]|nr:2-oxoacid:acceptor oxidoreductase subunit alpha [Syntrophales bacterium]